MESLISRVVAKVCPPSAGSQTGMEAMQLMHSHSGMESWPTLPASPVHPQKSQKRLRQRHGLAWVFVAHHKSGTKLLQKLARAQAMVMHLSACTDNVWLPKCSPEDPSTPMGIWFIGGPEDWSRSLAALEGRDVRLVHIIRDPVAMVVSGYIYHTRQGTHAPLDTPPPLRREVQLPPKDGIALEAQYVLNTTGPAMDHVSSRLRTSDGPSTQVMSVRFEDFDASSASFIRTAAELYNFTVGDMVSQVEMKRLIAKASMHDLHRHPTSDTAHVVLSKGVEEQVRRTLGTIPKHMLDDLYRARARLGY